MAQAGCPVAVHSSRRVKCHGSDDDAFYGPDSRDSYQRDPSISSGLHSKAVLGSGLGNRAVLGPGQNSKAVRLDSGQHSMAVLLDLDLHSMVALGAALDSRAVLVGHGRVGVLGAGRKPHSRVEKQADSQASDLADSGSDMGFSVAEPAQGGGFLETGCLTV